MKNQYDDTLNLMKKSSKSNYIFIVRAVSIHCLYLFFSWIYTYKVIMADILFIFKLVRWAGGFKIIQIDKETKGEKSVPFSYV